VRFAEPLVTKYDDISSAEWELSQVGWIRQVSSALKRGKIGEELVTAWARSEGSSVDARSHRGHDCRIDGLKLEVKTSLRWNSDRFVFFGLRDFDYDAVALLGLEPDNARLWIVPKAVLWHHAREQARGAEALGSRWVSFFADGPPAWLQEWGGSFAQAREALHRAARYRVERERDIADCESWLQLSSEIPWSWQDSHSDTASHPELICGPSKIELFDLPDAPQLLTGAAHAGATATHESPSLKHLPQGANHVIHQHQPRNPHWEPHE
jgi:hypothetical protein